MQHRYRFGVTGVSLKGLRAAACFAQLSKDCQVGVRQNKASRILPGLLWTDLKDTCLSSLYHHMVLSRSVTLLMPRVQGVISLKHRRPPQ